MFLSYLIPNWQVILLDFSLWLQSRSLSTRHPLSCIRAENCGLRAHQQKLSQKSWQTVANISMVRPPLIRGGRRIIGFAQLTQQYLFWLQNITLKINLEFKILRDFKHCIYFMRLHERHWLLLRNPQWHLILYHHSKFR